MIYEVRIHLYLPVDKRLLIEKMVLNYGSNNHPC